MNPRRLERLRIPVGDGWLHGSLTAAPTSRAALLLVPPFFHEWQRSYRFFALLADALAERGVDVLRFDYRGCGESSGESAVFLPSRAIEDADAALQSLTGRSMPPPLLMGVRAGALIAQRVAERHRLACWAWQPVENGADYLEALRRKDHRERNNRLRFPFLRGERASDPAVLMGQRLHAEFAIEMPILRMTAPMPRIDLPERCGEGDIALESPFFARWFEHVDLEGALPTSMIPGLAEAIAQRAERRHGAAA